MRRALETAVLVIAGLTACCLALFLAIFSEELSMRQTEHEILGIQRQEEMEKLMYYRTLNKVYGGDIWQEQ